MKSLRHQLCMSFSILALLRTDACFDARSVVNLNGFVVSTQACNLMSANCILCNHFRCYVWPPLEPPCGYESMQKAVVIKQTRALTPHYLLEALRCACVYITARRLTQEAVLSQRAAKCGLHNSVKLGQCSPELDFSLFCNIMEEWAWPRAEKPGIVRCKPVKTAKRVLLFVLRWKTFCYWIPNKSVDDVTSQ